MMLHVLNKSMTLHDGTMRMLTQHFVSPILQQLWPGTRESEGQPGPQVSCGIQEPQIHGAAKDGQDP